MRVVHVVRDLDVASGGPSRSVPALAERQARHEGTEVSILYQDRGNPVIEFAEGEVEYKSFDGKDLFFGKFLDHYLQPRAEFNEACIFHLHGLWSATVHQAARCTRNQRFPFVISTRGMLADWALRHKSLKKKIAWRLYQQRDLAGADCLLASSEFERRDVDSLLPDHKVVVIPNGCNERPVGLPANSLLPQDRRVRWALAIGRLHPVKGFAELIESWTSLSPPGWRLAIAGPDEAGYRKKLEELIRQHKLADQVILLGEVDDAQKWSLLDQCELFVAPSKTENFGMAIAEALRSGTPVITTTGTPWSDLIEYHCGWWIKPDAVAFEVALKTATEADAEVLSEMGANGQKLIAEKYSWSQIAAKTLSLYQSILAGHANG